MGKDYVKKGKGLHLAYTFSMLNKNMNAYYLEHVLRVTEESIEDDWPCWSLSNHDCMRMISRFDCFGERDGFQQMMLLLLLSLRGTLIIYYGEEVDLQEYKIIKDELQDPQGILFWPDIKSRDGCWLLFLWDSKLKNQGFNSGTTTWLPAAKNCHWIKQKPTQEVLFMFFKKCCKYSKNFQNFKMEVIEKYYWIESVLFLKEKQKMKPC
ncbi:alpha-amylase family glycosyl hydrolase [bacterium]|nr:alpha-amylase family glycosyl hydrolase [bacterium]